MAQASLDDLDLVLLTMARTIVDNADYFAQLDSIVGDGDFGYSLRNGWEVVLADYAAFDHSSAGAVLKKVGLTLTSKVGGVSGPIWGTAFLRAGVAAGEKTELAPEDVIAMLRAAITGIMARGGASLGEKTLLDALVPATDSLEAAIGDPAFAGDHGAAALSAPPTPRSRRPRTPRACSRCAAGPRTRASGASAPSTPARPRSA